ncbi:MAG TPA: hypothetical protein VKP69_15765 [Isosphaeraceae bacterium]|nr:hypothetical protein [Isosphaeraceae bacterium]
MLPQLGLGLPAPRAAGTRGAGTQGRGVNRIPFFLVDGPSQLDA